MENETYDGFHFLPDPENDDSYMMQFFTLERKEGNTANTEVIGGTEIGDLYNVLLMKQKEDGIEVTDVFQAIFADPIVYAEGLMETDFYGTFVKNTELSQFWWEKYVKATKETVQRFNATGVINDLQ